MARDEGSTISMSSKNTRSRATTDIGQSWTPDLTLLSYFVVSADAGNFGRAAQALGVQTSTVSRGVARIEDELGVTVFERGHFGVRLTNAGQAVLAQAKRVLADFDGLKRVGQCNGRGHVGEIHLGVRMPPIGNPIQSLLSTWRMQHPGVNLILHELSEHRTALGLANRELDAALVPRHSVWPDAASEPICGERMMVAVWRDHRFLKVKQIGWEQIREEVLLVQGWGDSQTAREFYSTFLGSGVQYRSHAASKQTIMALVGAKFGISLVTRSQAEVRFPNVSYRPISEGNAWVHVDLVWSQYNEEPAVGRFVAFMRDESRRRRISGV